MSSVVLDASALLRFLDDEPGAQRVERLLHDAASGETELFISAVNWGEVIYAIAQRHGVEAARKVQSRLSNLQLKVIGCGTGEAEEAALLKARFKIPYADAFAVSLAIGHAALLVTADYDFKSLPAGMANIEFLPVKTRSRR